MAKKETVRNGKKAGQNSTQRYIQFAGCHNDTLVLKNGGIRAIIEVGSVNFHLKSEGEQKGIILAYQRMLNSLDFPLQIQVVSRKLDIDEYLSDLKQKGKVQKNKLLREQMMDYTEYIAKLIQFTDIMEKRFFIIVPVNPPRVKTQSLFNSFLQYMAPEDSVLSILQRRREFTDLKKELDSRVNVVLTSLEALSLSTRRLPTAEIIELFYQMYNPDLSRQQKWKNLDEIAVEQEDFS